VLDEFWNTWEIAGSALVELDVWRWLYEHPIATAAELREATVRIARETWNRYYAPVLGGKDTALLAIYSHTISTPLYLFNYVLGHLIAFQVEEHVAGQDAATFASEFEASLGGPLGYGSSVWEGQAAIAIRDQYLRYTRSGLSIAAGRIDDPASFDYVSAHLGDLLYTDQYTRDPLLYAGADRGNGLFASYELNKHDDRRHVPLHENPTGITGTLVIGGKLQPFDRPFYLAAAQVGNSQNNLPPTRTSTSTSARRR
jgi:hypothetical protein